MSRASAEQPSSERRPVLQFGEVEERKLASLFRLWREKSVLGASDERQFALLLNELVKARAAEILEPDAFLRLVEPFAGEEELSDEEKQFLVRRVKPLLRTRELTKEEKEELAGLDSRSQEADHSGKGNGKDGDQRRGDAIRKRFTRAIGKLTGAIVAEFPELLDALPGLKSERAQL